MNAWKQIANVCRRALGWAIDSTDVARRVFGWMPAAAGVEVNEWSALNFSAVYRAISLISGSVRLLPVSVVDEEGRPIDDEEARRIRGLLNKRADQDTGGRTFREILTAHMLQWGNGYAEIIRDGAGRTVALHLMLPNKTRPYRENGQIFYEYTNPDGTKIILSKSEVLHVAGLGFDGLVGYSPIRLAREGIGLGLAAERYGASFFGNGAAPGGLLKHPGPLTEGAEQGILESWNRRMQGPGNAGKTMIIAEGMDWVKIGSPPEDAQFLQTRQFQITEIARWFGIPPHMLFDLDRSTNNNIEQQGIEFVKYCLAYWLSKWEEACEVLFSASSAGSRSIAHDASPLMMADTAGRFSAYNIGRLGGWLNVNEIRKKENLEPIGPAGDVYLQPVNMTDASKGLPGLKTNDKPADPTKPTGPPTQPLPADPTASDGTTDVQALALNRAQVSALIDLLAQVSTGQLPSGTVALAIQVAFPAFTQQQIDGLLKPLEGFKPASAEAPTEPTNKAPDTHPDLRAAA